MLDLKEVKIINKKHKKVISTCIFTPQENYMTYKSSVYVTGLIKSVETFPKVMGDEWIYRIYYDSMYDTYKTKDNKYYIDKDIYEPNPNNNAYNDIVKGSTKKFKNYAKFMRDWINYYLNRIKSYSYVELVSYDYPPLKVRGYEGHPYTFGSLIRLYAMFDSNVDVVFCVNSSNPISKWMANKIKSWEKGNKVMATCILKNYDFKFGNDSNDEIDQYHLNKYIEFLEKYVDNVPRTIDTLKKSNLDVVVRHLAGIFGIRVNKNSVKIGHKETSLGKLKFYLDSFIKEYSGNDTRSLENVWYYSVDEDLMSLALFPLLDCFEDSDDITESVDLIAFGSLTIPQSGYIPEVILYTEDIHAKNSKNNMQIKRAIPHLRYEPRVHNLVGFRFLTKLYNKHINDIKIKIDKTGILWGIQSPFDEYIPVIYMFDIGKDNRRHNGLASLDKNGFINYTVITDDPNNNYKKKEVFGYGRYSDISKSGSLVVRITNRLIKEYRNINKRVSVVYNPKSSGVTLSDTFYIPNKKTKSKTPFRKNSTQSKTKRKTKRKTKSKTLLKEKSTKTTFKKSKNKTKSKTKTRLKK